MSEMPPQPPAPIDPAEMLRMVWRRKWMLVVPWVTAVLIGVAAALLLKPVYTSTTTLVLDRGQSLGGQLAGISPSIEVEQQADIMREQVQSSLFLRSVVAATGVKEDRLTRVWALKAAEKYPGLSPNEQVEAFLVDYLRQAITVRSVSKGKLFQVEVDDFEPARAHRFCEAVANQFVASSKARQLEAVQAQQEFSVQQLQIYKRALNEAEARLEAARRSAIATTFSGSLVNAANVGAASSLLDQASADVDDQRQRLADLRAQFAGKLRENDPQALSSAEVAALTRQMETLQSQLGRAMLSEGAGPPGVGTGAGASAGVRVTMARKNAELEAALAAAAARALPSASPEARDLAVRYRMAQTDLAARESWRSWLSGQISSYQRQVVQAPDRDLGISRLQAEVDQQRALYTAFEQQSAAAQIAEAFQNAKVSGRFIIMQPATLPLSPTKPNRVLIVLLAMVIGALVGLGTVLVVEHNDQSMKNADEVEHLLGLPVLGTIPRVEELERRRQKPRAAPAAGPGALPAPRDLGLIQRLRVESPLGLEFKRIYLNLARTRGRTLPRTMLVTSSTRGEGKTATSACLGITLAREHRQRTLLVDFDLRSPALHRALGMPSSSWGLAQMLSQKQFDERFVRHTALENLDFLAAGKTERPTAEIVEQDAVEWFLREASQRYSLVVLDTAPTLAVPDPLILGRAVEGVLYVVKAGSTVRKAAEYGVRVQREARDNLLGVLMNDSGEFLPQYYGYKAHYYGYTTEIAEG
jgi:capsular exopolysaccharide synthesis family protein